MLRLNIGLALGGLAAVAAGLLGGWVFVVGLPLQGSALAAVEGASPSIAATPAPAAAPPPGPSTAATNAAPATNDAAGKPHIHLDGERSELSYEGESGSLYINKDRLSVRTPFGKFDIDW